MKEYEILYDTGEARKLVTQINRMAKEGWQAKSIGALGAVESEEGNEEEDDGSSFGVVEGFQEK